MQTIVTIGLDIAKSVFQLHGVDAGGQVIVRRQLKRRYVLTFFQKLSPCLVGIEACGSAHQTWPGRLLMSPFDPQTDINSRPRPTARALRPSKSTITVWGHWQAAGSLAPG